LTSHGLFDTFPIAQKECLNLLFLEAISERNRIHFDLLRALGISQAITPVLTDKLEFTEKQTLSVEDAIAFALAHRTELQAGQKLMKLSRLMLESIKGERVPSIEFRGDYGLMGEDFDQRFGTYQFGAFLSIPIFDGGQRQGRIQESNSQVRQEILRAKNLANQIIVEVRDAIMTLDTMQEQVLVSQETLDLAQKELRLSQKAFSIGTLTHLNDGAIKALFNYKAAQINLARAQGRIETFYTNPPLYVTR